ncbi:MAG: DUF1846 domain-containing protein [Armatimonadota bacterium]
MTQIGFDNDRYIEEQTAAILERVEQSAGKLYLEFGGKLTFDFHASRVLPGYDPNVKMRLLQGLKDQMEVVFCVYALDLEQGRIRGDFGITYDVATLKAIDDLRDWGIRTTAVVLTRYHEETTGQRLMERLQRSGIATYTHPEIPDYPNDVDRIVSEEGYGRNAYIETSARIVVVTGTGPGSGKMSTCLSQLYHEHQRAKRAGYAKFETFPIWNLPLEHPVNLAYEAATVDIGDVVMIDPFHLEAYDETAVNYNRDVENFPILKSILERIGGKDSATLTYQSPTDMGVNRAASGIIDDEVVREASKQEIIRRYFRHHWEARMGVVSQEVAGRARRLMQRLDLEETDRPVVQPARQAAEDAEARGKGNENFYCGAAIELPDGRIITGSNSPLFHSASAAIIKAMKKLADIPDAVHLLPGNVIRNLTELKDEYLDSRSPSLNVQELLVALGLSMASNPVARACLQTLPELRGCQMHLTHVPGSGDENGLRKLGIVVTTDALPTSQSYFLK